MAMIFSLYPPAYVMRCSTPTAMRTFSMMKEPQVTSRVTVVQWLATWLRDVAASCASDTSNQPSRVGRANNVPARMERLTTMAPTIKESSPVIEIPSHLQIFICGTQHASCRNVG